jgi:hypothetical protein
MNTEFGDKAFLKTANQKIGEREQEDYVKMVKICCESRKWMVRN